MQAVANNSDSCGTSAGIEIATPHFEIDRTARNGGFMKIALGSLVMILLASAPAHAQQIGGSLAPPASFQVLPWTAPANPQALTVSGTDITFMPSRFLTFDRAVAAG